MNLQNSLKKIENKLPKPENWKFWILFILLCKIALFIFCINKVGVNPIDGFWGHFGGDTESYLDPIESIINKGEYQPDYRMPGYGVFYLPLYWLFSKATALNILICLQLIFSVVSVYFLAKIALKVFKSNTLFYVTIIIAAVSTYIDLYITFILTESFTTSFLIFAVYSYIKFTENNKSNYLLLCGLLLTEVVFLRPVFLPILFLFVIVLIVHLNKSKSISKLKTIGLFLLPFLLIDSAWLIRNYKHHHKIAPLTTSFYYPGLENGVFLPVSQFLQSWGGSFVWWDTGAEIRWFGFGESIEFGKGVERKTSLPSYIYTSQFNEDSLLIVRSKVLIILNDTTKTNEEKRILTDEVKASLDKFTISVKKEKPFVHYIKAPLLFLKTFFVHSGTYNLFAKSAAELNKVEYLTKIFYSLLYIFTLLFGFLGALLLFKKSMSFNAITLLVGIIAFTSLVHPVILRLTESRYIIPAWPFIIICASYAVIWIYNFIFMAKQKNVK